MSWQKNWKSDSQAKGKVKGPRDGTVHMLYKGQGRIYYSKDIFAEWTKAKYNHKIKSSIKLIHENIFIKAASLLFDSGFNQGNNNLSNICMLFQVHNTPHCRSLMRLIIKVIDNGIFERSLVFSPSNMLYNRPTCLLLFVDVLDGNIWGNPFQQVLHGRSDRGAWLNCWCRWTGTSSNKPWSTSAWKWDWKWLQGSCGGHPVVNFDQCFWTKEMRVEKNQISNQMDKNILCLKIWAIISERTQQDRQNTYSHHAQYTPQYKFVMNIFLWREKIVPVRDHVAQYF